MEEKESGSYKWICLGIMTMGTFMAFLDTSIVNIAITPIMSSLSCSIDKVQWVITAYMLTSAAAIPVTGYLGDTFGLKKIYILSIIIFTIGSFLCGVSWNINILILARVIQAIGGGMIMPISMSVIYKIMPQELIGTAAGIWGIAAMAAPAIGPTLGGYIIEYLNWNLIFNINIPVGIITVVLGMSFLKELPTTKGKSLDFIGIITSILGLVSLLYVLSKGSDIDFRDVKYPLLIVFGVCNLIIFTINELTIDEPLLDLRLFKNFKFSAGIIILGGGLFAAFGVIFLVPLYLQNLIGLSSVETGLIIMYYAIGAAIFMPLSGKLSDKIGEKPIIILGTLLIIGSTYALYFLNTNTKNSTICLLIFIRGIGVGSSFMACTNESLKDIPEEFINGASALQNTVKQIIGSIAVTVITVVMKNRQTLHYHMLAEQFNSVNPGTLNFLSSIQGYAVQNGGNIQNAKTTGVYAAYMILNKQSYMLGIDDATMISLIIAVVTLPFAFMLKNKRKVKNS